MQTLKIPLQTVLVNDPGRKSKQVDHFSTKCKAQVLFLTLALSAGVANATLIGDSIQGSITDLIGGAVGTQFTSSATVGAGTEFTGTWLFPPSGQTWDIQVDIDASSFSITVNENTAGFNNIFGGPPLFSISLADLDWVGVPGQIINVSQSSGPGGVDSIAFTADTITVTWISLLFGFANDPPTGGTYTFNIDTQHVPEPSTLALLGIGLAALARKRNSGRITVPGLGAA